MSILLQTAPAGQLVAAALIGITVLVLLITRYKLHPFLSLIIGSMLVGGIAGLPLKGITTSFTTGATAKSGPSVSASR